MFGRLPLLQRQIIMDADDVVVDWLGPIREWLIETKQVKLKSQWPSSHRLNNWLDGIGYIKAAALFVEFNERSGWMSKLPAADQFTCEVLHQLHADQFDLHILSAPGKKKLLLEQRRQCLEALGIDHLFNTVRHIPLFSSKLPELIFHEII